ncbi:transporter [Marinobacter lipolyticus SM19]|uniref:Transporter n=1 Tax=Marinobacter lipolyticus SM19 TaxID=1318628 RepID=R8AZM0_9GAMM|nr:efflux RND transporter permease subunit [Marinobacter lipolyticus]EON91764.1 transporter [Marinobacter lipolyticus SM19]
MKDSNFLKLQHFVEACIRYRLFVVSAYMVVTAIMLVAASRVEIMTVFEDLLPQDHPYVQVHQKIKNTFGGSNLVSIMLEVEQGDIFNRNFLSKLQKVTKDLQQVDGVNPFQITSLASKKLKEVRGSTNAIDVRSLMWPDVPTDDQGLAELKESVLSNSLVHGAYVSQDLKAALITVDFYDDELDYSRIFSQISGIADTVQDDDVRVRIVGEPILYGWVNHYLPETLQIFLLTICSLIALLFVIARTWRGTLLPLLAGTTSAIWALGSAQLLGFNLDPLVIVIAFLITARAISHSVQLVTRFDDELARGAESTTAAAQASMLQLFKPGFLGVMTDAGCIMVVMLTPIPLLEKVAVIGTIWVLTIILTACVLTPVLLSWIKKPDGYVHGLDLSAAIQRVLSLCIHIATSRWRFAMLSMAVLTFVVSGLYATKIQVGDAEPGSPILWPNSTYNQDSAAINSQFQGADQMLVVFSGNEPDAVKEPFVLRNMGELQKFMAAQPEVGGSLSVSDVIPSVRSVLWEGNPRHLELGADRRENGELLYMYTSGSDPGDMARFADPQYQDAALTFYFRDHKGETIRTAIARVKEYVEQNPIAEGEYQLAGGLIGTLAAVNEVILVGQVESIALALLVLVIFCAIAYRSTVAGLFFMVPVVLANTVTFSYMAWQGIGMNISTLPVAALGIGLGVDYAIYIVDGIREQLHKDSDLKKAIVNSLRTAGKGVLITALTLTASVVLWWASSLRFQADMGILMGIWLFVSAVSALLIVPSMVYVLRPDFITAGSVRPADVASETQPKPQKPFASPATQTMEKVM